MCLRARPSGGELRPAEWFEVGRLDEPSIHPFTRTRINDALNDRPAPHRLTAGSPSLHLLAVQRHLPHDPLGQLGNPDV